MKNFGKRWLALLLSLLVVIQSCFVSPKLTLNVFAHDESEDPAVPSVSVNIEDGEKGEQNGQTESADKEEAPSEEANSSEDGILSEEQSGLEDSKANAPANDNKQGELDSSENSADVTENAEVPSVEPSGEAKEPTRGEDTVTVTFDPTTESGESLAPITIEVVIGEAIGSKLPTVPNIPGYITFWVIEGTNTKVTAETEVAEEFKAVVGKEKIIYTVTFVQEDGTEETRTTSIDDGFAVNDLPVVTPKTNKIGKWVYPDTTTEFPVGTVISGDLTVRIIRDISIIKYCRLTQLRQARHSADGLQNLMDKVHNTLHHQQSTRISHYTLILRIRFA